MNTRHLRTLALPALLLLTATACTAKAEPVATTPAAAPNVTVAYEAFIPDTVPENLRPKRPTADITLATLSGTSQFTADLPMSSTKTGKEGLTFTARPGGAAVISVQNTASYGGVGCRIKVNGKTVSENTARGGYKIAMCKASY